MSNMTTDGRMGATIVALGQQDQVSLLALAERVEALERIVASEVNYLYTIGEEARSHGRTTQLDQLQQLAANLAFGMDAQSPNWTSLKQVIDTFAPNQYPTIFFIVGSSVLSPEQKQEIMTMLERTRLRTSLCMIFQPADDHHGAGWQQLANDVHLANLGELYVPGADDVLEKILAKWYIRLQQRGW